MEIILVLHNIRSTYNVGAILRTAEGLGVFQVVLSGYTPRINDPDLLPHLREKLNKEISKTALGAEKLVNIYSSHDIFSDLLKWQKEGFKIVGLENHVGKERKTEMIDAPDLEKRLGEKIVLVLGEEVAGIDYSLYEIIDQFIEIPMKGQKESFNVSVAAGIALAYLTL